MTDKKGPNVDSYLNLKLIIILTEDTNAVMCDGQIDKTFHIRCSDILSLLVCFFTKNYQGDV